MDPSPREREVAERYLCGECNEIQLNYLVHAEKLDLAAIERLLDEARYRTPLATAAKFLLACVAAQTAVMLLYPCLSPKKPDPFLYISASSAEMPTEAQGGRPIPELRSGAPARD